MPPRKEPEGVAHYMPTVAGGARQVSGFTGHVGWNLSQVTKTKGALNRCAIGTPAMMASSDTVCAMPQRNGSLTSFDVPIGIDARHPLQGPRDGRRWSFAGITSGTAIKAPPAHQLGQPSFWHCLCPPGNGATAARWDARRLSVGDASRRAVAKKPASQGHLCGPRAGRAACGRPDQSLLCPSPEPADESHWAPAKADMPDFRQRKASTPAPNFRQPVSRCLYFHCLPTLSGWRTARRLADQGWPVSDEQQCRRRVDWGGWRCWWSRTVGRDSTPAAAETSQTEYTGEAVAQLPMMAKKANAKRPRPPRELACHQTTKSSSSMNGGRCWQMHASLRAGKWHQITENIKTRRQKYGQGKSMPKDYKRCRWLMMGQSEYLDADIAGLLPDGGVWMPARTHIKWARMKIHCQKSQPVRYQSGILISVFPQCLSTANQIDWVFLGHWVVFPQPVCLGMHCCLECGSSSELCKQWIGKLLRVADYLIDVEVGLVHTKDRLGLLNVKWRMSVPDNC